MAGTLTRRYQGLLVAALKPPLGRTLLCTKVDETVEYESLALPLFTNRWAGNAIDPYGYRTLERFTLVLSTESSPAFDGEQAWERRAQHEERLVAAWKRARPEARKAPDWIKHLVLASDQFIVRRPTPSDADGMTVIAGYHWFGDWGR